MKICIIMSTYNGSRYVKEQLDSIVGQSGNCELVIYIRDDGSTDDTVEIVRDYAGKHDDVEIIVDKASNVGASKSFYLALNECPDADIYAFSDQDDVWEPGKMDAAITVLKDAQESVLWCSDYTVVDKDLKVLRSNGIEEPCYDQFKALYYGHIPGCVMVFNKSLLCEMRKVKIEHIRMHDVLALNVALLTGKVIYDKECYVKYRQHESNTIGYGHKKIRPIKWIKDKTKLIYEKEQYSMAEYSVEAMRIWSDIMDKATIEEYMLISDSKDSFIKRLKLLSRPYTKYNYGRTRLSIRCKILFGLI